MPPSATRHVQHGITVNAPAARVYDLISDVQKWPQVFGPTVHVEYVEQRGPTERIRIWATANGTAKSWLSRRDRDPDRMRIAFRQERSQQPVGGMGGMWIVQPRPADTCEVRLLHDYFAATGEPADLDWIDKAVDRNSTAELAALKSTAEAGAGGEPLTFADTVEVDGPATAVYDFLNEAQLWEQRLPHVSRVSLTEQTPGLQVLEMDTRTKDGSVHTTCSVRVCQPHRRIVYKQTVLPALMSLHTGEWLIEERDGQPLSVTSRHTVKINEDRITGVLGPDADLPAALAFVRTALSGNSTATLRHAKAYAEQAAAAQAAS
jgi:aromatase